MDIRAGQPMADRYDPLCANKNACFDYQVQWSVLSPINFSCAFSSITRCMILHMQARMTLPEHEALLSFFFLP